MSYFYDRLSVGEKIEDTRLLAIGYGIEIGGDNRLLITIDEDTRTIQVPSDISICRERRVRWVDAPFQAGFWWFKGRFAYRNGNSNGDHFQTVVEVQEYSDGEFIVIMAYDELEVSDFVGSWYPVESPPRY